jgi:hypothetical protein
MCGEIANDLVFCVFCVFNISEPPLVRDPPPVPYVDITRLQQYSEILENISIESFRDVKYILKQIKAEVDALKQNDTFNMLGMNLETVFASFENEYNNALITNNIDSIKPILSTIIDVISTSNAATPIGTILFTDAVAKNFAQVNTCNVAQQIKFNDYNYTNISGQQNSKKSNPHAQAKPPTSTGANNQANIDTKAVSVIANITNYFTSLDNALKKVAPSYKFTTDLIENFKKIERDIASIDTHKISNNNNNIELNKLKAKLKEYKQSNYYP